MKNPDRNGNSGPQAAIGRMLQDRNWFEVASFASYSRQTQTLQLKPWQSPPVWINDPD